MDITTIILTYNEELHLERCLNNAKLFSKEIIIIDSYSSDNTLDIAKKMNVKILQNKWENNYARQFNWGLSNAQIKTKWVLRLDADEYLSDELIQEIKKNLDKNDDQVKGYSFPLERIFINKHIKRGIGKMNLLRLFQFGFAKCENRWMDEHIQLENGNVKMLNYPFFDHNLNNLTWWINKHNNYSIREAIDLLNIELNFLNINTENNYLSPEAKSKRIKKIKYAKSPLFFRSFIYFLYRYFYKLGFIGGKEDFLWHFLQGWWYRTLVDA